METSDARSDQIAVNVEFAVADERWNARFLVPSEPCRLIALLPALRGFTDAVVDTASRTEERNGRTISCRKGCGHCCRQLVPISQAEAEDLRALVADLPEPRRSEIRARFAEAARQLADAGLLETLRSPEQASEETLRPLGMDYFRLGIPCPFLEAESCSIHPDRPLACREYLVTSPPEHCAHPSAETVNCVPLPTSVSKAVARVGANPAGRFARWTFLILALDETGTDSDDERCPGPELLREVFHHMAKKGDSHE